MPTLDLARQGRRRPVPTRPDRPRLLRGPLAPRLRRRSHGLGEPRDQRTSRDHLSAHALVTARLVQPRLERVPAGGRELLHPEAVDAGMVDRVAPGRALELGLGWCQAASACRREPSLEAARPAIVVDRRPESLELVGSGVVQAAGHEQPVERQVEVEAAGGAVADRDAEVLLERRARPEPEVVCTAGRSAGCPGRSACPRARAQARPGARRSAGGSPGTTRGRCCPRARVGTRAPQAATRPSLCS